MTEIIIKTDGKFTGISINGEKIEKGFLFDFEFHAEPLEVDCSYGKYKEDENGHIMLNEDKTDTVKEYVELFKSEGKKDDF